MTFLRTQATCPLEKRSELTPYEQVTLSFQVAACLSLPLFWEQRQNCLPDAGVFFASCKEDPCAAIDPGIG